MVSRKDDPTLENAVYYDKIQNLLRTHSEFITYDDTANCNLVIISGNQGALRIGYTLPKPVINPPVDLHHIYGLLEEKFSRKEFPRFFKDQTYERLKNISDEKRRFLVLLEEAEFLIESAERNLEVYLKGFSFEKIRSQLREEKTKYFQSSKEALSKVNTQAVSTLLSASAAVIAIYRTNTITDIPTMSIITLSYMVYSGFSSYSLRLILEDVKDLLFDFRAEQKRAERMSTRIYEDFKEEYIKIEKRIVKLNRLLWVFFFIIKGLDLLVINYILSQDPGQGTSIPEEIRYGALLLSALLYVLIGFGVI